MAIKWLIDASYFVAAILFILGLKGMSSPVSARKGIVWAGVGMVLATVVTFLTPGMGNLLLMIIAIGLGGVLAWVSGKKVAMTDMPQMVAIYNGMGGGAAAAIAAVEFARGVAFHAADAPPAAPEVFSGADPSQLLLRLLPLLLPPKLLPAQLRLLLQ